MWADTLTRALGLQARCMKNCWHPPNSEMACGGFPTNLQKGQCCWILAADSGLSLTHCYSCHRQLRTDKHVKNLVWSLFPPTSAQDTCSNLQELQGPLEGRRVCVGKNRTLLSSLHLSDSTFKEYQLNCYL